MNYITPQQNSPNTITQTAKLHREPNNSGSAASYTKSTSLWNSSAHT